MKTAFVIVGEHFSVPGMQIDVARSLPGAEKAAARMVNILLSDAEMHPDANSDNWEGRLAMINHFLADDLSCQVAIVEKTFFEEG